MNIFNLLFSLSYQIIPRISRNLFLIMHSSGKHRNFLSRLSLSRILVYTGCKFFTKKIKIRGDKKWIPNPFFTEVI
jgi:hypothetical protein